MGLNRRPLPLALPHPGSNRRRSSRKLSYSYVNESRGQVKPMQQLPHKFTGKERDGESGLDNFGARYFGSSLGRFMSPDPPLMDQHIADPQSWNLYSYVRNNPVSFVDPKRDHREKTRHAPFKRKSRSPYPAHAGYVTASGSAWCSPCRSGRATAELCADRR